jgi:antagonist of KipI
MGGDVRVIDPGFLTTVQDAPGRPGLGRFGIPSGGALDPGAARLANRLVGNGGDEPVIEMTLHGPMLEWRAAAHIGLAGADLRAAIGPRHLSPGHSHRLPAGAILRCGSGGARHGMRAYLAVEGGFVVTPVLGSAATDRRSGYGGLDGRELRPGDVLAFRAAQSGHLRSIVHRRRSDDGPIRLIPAPTGLGWFDGTALRAFCAVAWTVAPESDRTGMRLIGAHLTSSVSGVPSVGVPVGSIEVPPSGEPIITFVDGPVTGGYPLLGVVPVIDHHRLAQAAPGTVLRFEAVSVADIRRARGVEAEDDEVELDPGEVGAAWAR